MGDLTNDSGNFTSTIEGLGKFDGRTPSDFRDWQDGPAAVLGVTRGDISSLINGKSRRSKESFTRGISPTLAGGNGTLDKEIADTDRANDYLHAIFYVLTEKPPALLVTKHEDTIRTSGNELKPLQELVGKNNNITDQVIPATVEYFLKTSTPADNIMQKSSRPL